MTTCVVCRTGIVEPGTTTLTVERDRMTLVLKMIPARVCGHCGEAYFDRQTTERIEAIVDELLHVGVEVAVRDYAAA